MDIVEKQKAKIEVSKITNFMHNELEELCDAVISTTHDTYGFSIGMYHEDAPNTHQLESYFKGVMLIPEREIFIAKLDKLVCGSLQILKPIPSNKTSNFAVTIDNHFVTPWARGFGIAKFLLKEAEEEVKRQGFSLIKLSVRANRNAAINLYESHGYTKWGTLEKYEKMAGSIIPGHFYYKEI